MSGQFVKDGYRFIQGLIPVKMHRELTRISKELGQSRSESLRDAIDAFLKNKDIQKTTLDNSNDNSD